MKNKDYILKVENISKSFLLPDKTKLSVLEDLSMDIEKASILAITGASGSGKSTLLHLIGGLDDPDSGDIFFKGKSISAHLFFTFFATR